MKYRALGVVDIDFSLDINGIKYLSDKSSILESGQNPLSSAALFELAVNALPFDYDNIGVCNDVQEKVGVGTTVWGVKKVGDKFLSELYFFYPDDNCSHRFGNIVSSLDGFIELNEKAIPDLGGYQCISVDLNAAGLDCLNIYYLDREDQSGVIASSWELNCISGSMKKRNTYFASLSKPGFSESGFSFDKSYAPIVEVLSGYVPGRADEFLSLVKGFEFSGTDDDLNPPVGCAIKDGAFGLYYMGLGVSELIMFLEEMEFPGDFVEDVRHHWIGLSHLKFDVGLDLIFGENSIKISKSSFFGSL